MKIIYKLYLSLVLMASMGAHAAGGGGAPAGGIGIHNYVPLNPAFVVNLRDGDALRFMQATIQVMTYDTKVIEALQTHAAPIRHELMLLLSDQTVSGMYNVAHRTKVQEAALAVVQNILAKYAGIKTSDQVADAEGKQHPSSVKELYFTQMVIQ